MHYESAYFLISPCDHLKSSSDELIPYSGEWLIYRYCLPSVAPRASPRTRSSHCRRHGRKHLEWVSYISRGENHHQLAADSHRGGSSAAIRALRKVESVGCKEWRTAGHSSDAVEFWSLGEWQQLENIWGSPVLPAPMLVTLQTACFFFLKQMSLRWKRNACFPETWREC